MLNYRWITADVVAWLWRVQFTIN